MDGMCALDYGGNDDIGLLLQLHLGSRHIQVCLM
jgi:hypothetical protein